MIDNDELHKQAEEIFREKAAQSPEILGALSPEKTRQALHELRVHQIELEIQNEELRRAHRELEVAHDKYFNFYDLAPVGYVTLSEKGLIQEANLTIAAMLETARGTLIKQMISRFILKEDQDIYYRYRKQLFATDEAQSRLREQACAVCELRMVKQDGTAFWTHLTAAAMRDTKGEPACRIVINNISERKRTEKALQESEGRYKRITEGLTDYQYTVRVEDGRAAETRQGPACATVTGYTAEEFAADAYLWFRMVAPEDRKLVQERAQQVLAGNEIAPMEHRIVRKDGETRWVRDTVILNKDASGKLLSYDGVIKDITASKRAEVALRESEQKLKTLFELLPVGVSVLDADSKVVYLNPALEKILDISREGLLRGDYLNRTYLRPDGAPMSADEFASNRAIREQRAVYNLEIGIVKDPAGKQVVWTNVSAMPVAFSDWQVIIVTVDITERKRVEEEKAKLEAQLQQAQKMESVGRLAGGVAHDFNNMLSVILGYAELGLKQVDPAQPLHADLTEIRKAAERAADLTRQLLAFARKQTVAPRVLKLNETVAGMLKMLQRLIGEDIRLIWQPEADLWPVKVDPSQIDQILANLCVNARDAITDVGKIAIATGNSAFDAAYCANHAEFAAGEYVRLAVSDDGCGMNKETLTHLFEPFFTTKGVGKGTGLGLAMIYGIVKQNRGFIDVHSAPGSGTKFTIYLPRYVGKAEQTARPAGAAKPVRRGRETILLVEDEPAVLVLITRMLEKQSYTVLAASTPGEAIRLAREHAGEIHLLMTDVVMPEMNGRDLAKNLLSLYPDIKRLFMSGYTADLIAQHGVLDEGVYFIQKPITIKDLAAKVRAVLDRE